MEPEGWSRVLLSTCPCREGAEDQVLVMAEKKKARWLYFFSQFYGYQGSFSVRLSLNTIQHFHCHSCHCVGWEVLGGTGQAKKGWNLSISETSAKLPQIKSNQDFSSTCDHSGLRSHFPSPLSQSDPASTTATPRTMWEYKHISKKHPLMDGGMKREEQKKIYSDCSDTI